MKFTIKYIILALFSAFSIFTMAQENVWEEMLKKEVEVANPVYKPVIGGGVSIFNFYGDIRNDNKSMSLGNMGYKVNIHTYLDQKQIFKSNLFIMVNQLSVNKRSFDVPQNNYNFSSDMVFFGLNIQYDFRHFLKGNYFMVPFVSAGIESFFFNSKSDMYNENGQYSYWPDGTIRNTPYNESGSVIVQRDYSYETDLRTYNTQQGNKYYSRNSFAIPTELGLQFFISPRITLQLSWAYHYSFSDYIDNIAATNTVIQGNKRTDCFSSTNFTMHLDLFSDAKTKIQTLLFADVDFDYAMYGDLDNDAVFDGWDKCPYTPEGVEVDTSGCPFDGDNDGIPDFQDLQKNTKSNAIVDENGVEISDELIESFFTKEGVKRSEVAMYLKLYYDLATKTTFRKKVPIPAKFKEADYDRDGYISYEEIIKTIDAFYEFEVKLTYRDIQQLIEFFFSQ